MRAEVAQGKILSLNVKDADLAPIHPDDAAAARWQIGRISHNISRHSVARLYTFVCLGGRLTEKPPVYIACNLRPIPRPLAPTRREGEFTPPSPGPLPPQGGKGVYPQSPRPLAPTRREGELRIRGTQGLVGGRATHGAAPAIAAFAGEVGESKLSSGRVAGKLYNSRAFSQKIRRLSPAGRRGKARFGSSKSQCG